MTVDESGPIWVRMGHNQACTGGINDEGIKLTAALRVTVSQKAHISLVSADGRADGRNKCRDFFRDFCWPLNDAGNCR